MMNKTLYSALYEDWYPFHHFASKLETVFLPEQLKDKNSILILWGGEDISPSLYGEKPNKYTYAKDTLSTRDEVEVSLAKEAIKLGIPVIGICRGAQLMCALSGGKLVQHVNNHSNGAHQIETKDGHRIKASSLHHQMMIPFEIPHEVIAKSRINISGSYLGENNVNIEMPCEPEIVYFPETKCLAIQGHPEYMEENTLFVQYCNKLVEEYLQ